MAWNLGELTHNQLVELHRQVRQRLDRTARGLKGRQVRVPASLLDEQTPPERRLATVTRVTVRNGIARVSITPGGRWGAASGLNPWDVRLVEDVNLPEQ